MRLFLYYALHSFFNQLKKLFKTWVLVFIVVCALIGGLIGFMAATLSDAAEDRMAESGEVLDDDSSSTELEEEVIEITLPGDEDTFSPGSLVKDAAGLIELIGGLIILIVFIFEALSADKNGSKIFLPADINILFASPMKPQSVLLFRVLTQLGTAIILSIYLLFQLPNLILNMGLSTMAAFGVIITWGLAIAAGKMIQVLLYTICSSKPGFKKYISRGVYAIIILLVVGVIVSAKPTGMTAENDGIFGKFLLYYNSLKSFMNAPWTRYIPLWGWIKGFLYYSVSENLVLSIVFFLLTACGCGILAYIIYHVKADFYEDAMAKSEETAELLERANQQANGGITMIRRKKDRSDKLRRDGLNHGQGAAMFFHKTMYNRFRFAHLGILTKTADTYLVVGVGMALLSKFAFLTDSLIPTALVLAAISFFRSLGNPLEQDTKMGYFNMIPSKTWAKLFFSTLGGSVNCFLDLFIGLLIATLILQANLLSALGWALVIVSVDLYATLVGAFIDLSIPVAAGKTIKQMIQIMFIYFGLLPDVAVVAVALIFSTPLVAIVSVLFANLVLSALFFVLTTLAIDMSFGK